VGVKQSARISKRSEAISLTCCVVRTTLRAALENSGVCMLGGSGGKFV